MSLFLVVSLGLWGTTPATAEGQQRVQDPETHDGDTVVTGQGGTALQDGTGNGQGTTGGTRQGIEDALQSLTRVSERVNNPEIGEQIRTMTESHEQVQNKVMTAFSNMNSRSKAMKFIFGPSYQNAGEVKAQAAQLRADAGELASMKEELTSLTDQGEVQAAIDSLEEEATALEGELEEQLEGFSLFGWLNRILSGY